MLGLPFETLKNSKKLHNHFIIMEHPKNFSGFLSLDRPGRAKLLFRETREYVIIKWIK